MITRKQLFLDSYYQIYHKIRILFALGKLPDFLIIGAPKSGTGYIWNLLLSHPQVQMSPNFRRIERYKGTQKYKDRRYHNRKEIRYFSAQRMNSVNWYKACFNDNDKLQGEATPVYLTFIACHEQMHKIVPEAKLIVILRNPVSRSFSNYNHMKFHKSSWNDPFSKNADYFDIKKCFKENVESEINGNCKSGFILRPSLYIDQIESLLNFYKKEQLLILIMEEMSKKPEEAYRKICSFLSIEPKPLSIDLYKKMHVIPYSERMENETKRMLYELFAPYNKRLFNFLGREIEEWGDCYCEIAANK